MCTGPIAFSPQQFEKQLPLRAARGRKRDAMKAAKTQSEKRTARLEFKADRASYRADRARERGKDLRADRLDDRAEEFQQSLLDLGADESAPDGASGSIGDPIVSEALAAARRRNRSRQGFRSTLSGGGAPMDNSAAVERLDPARPSPPLDATDPRRRRRRTQGPQAPRRSLLG